MIVLVSGQTKQLCCFSDVACQAAQKSGLTEMSMEDHAVTQLMKDRKVSLTLERPWSRCHVLFFWRIERGFLGDKHCDRTMRLSPSATPSLEIPE